MQVSSKKEKESKKIRKSVTIRFPLFFVHFSSEILLAEPCVLHYHYLSPFPVSFLEHIIAKRNKKVGALFCTKLLHFRCYET